MHALLAFLVAVAILAAIGFQQDHYQAQTDWARAHPALSQSYDDACDAATCGGR